MEHSILIIDDDPDDCELVVEGLHQVGWNFDVEFITDSQESLNFLQWKNSLHALPSVIILDLNMPKIGGMEILAQIKQAYKDLPVILYSTTCSDEIVKKAKQLGAHDCIKKGTSYTDNLKFARMVLAMVKATI
jgi:CheY-like chemotaxis protein